MSIQIRATIKEAWHLVKGSKRAFFTCFLALGLVQAILLCVQEEIYHLAPHANWPGPAITIVMWFLIAPLMAGFLMLGLQRARGQSVKWKSGLCYFNSILPLFSAFLITMMVTWFTMVASGFLLFKTLPFFGHIAAIIILGLIVCLITTAVNALFSFSAILILDRKLPFYSAVIQSIKMISQHFLSFYGLVLILFLLNIIGAALVGIGLIWTIPLTYTSLAVVYNKSVC